MLGIYSKQWALMLGAYSYTIKFKKCEENLNADALSRLPLHTQHKDHPAPAEVGVPGHLTSNKHVDTELEGSGCDFVQG